jgi:hypothetical protein
MRMGLRPLCLASPAIFWRFDPLNLPMLWAPFIACCRKARARKMANGRTGRMQQRATMRRKRMMMTTKRRCGTRGGRRSPSPPSAREVCAPFIFLFIYLFICICCCPCSDQERQAPGSFAPARRACRAGNSRLPLPFFPPTPIVSSSIAQYKAQWIKKGSAQSAESTGPSRCPRALAMDCQR